MNPYTPPNDNDERPVTPSVIDEMLINPAIGGFIVSFVAAALWAALAWRMRCPGMSYGTKYQFRNRPYLRPRFQSWTEM
jgi:hypothetical protein